MIAAYYLDTSALAKRYVDETGSAWLRSIADPSSPSFLVTSKLTLAEMTSALARRRRESTLDLATYAALHRSFQNDCQTQYELMDITDVVIADARHLLERHPLRTLDALHLASALIAHRFLLEHYDTPLIVISADEGLLAAASDEEMTTDNPNSHT